MADASHVKVNPDAAGAKGVNQTMDRAKGGSTRKYLWPWMLMVLSVRFFVTEATVADCSVAEALI